MSKKTELDKIVSSRLPKTMTDVLSKAPVFCASPQVSDHMAPTWGHNINDRELLSIYALLAYVAHNQNVRQDLVEKVVEAEFGVDNVAKIRRDDYERAIAFLVDLRLDELVN